MYWGKYVLIEKKKKKQYFKCSYVLFQSFFPWVPVVQYCCCCRRELRNHFSFFFLSYSLLRSLKRPYSLFNLNRSYTKIWQCRSQNELMSRSGDTSWSGGQVSANTGTVTGNHNCASCTFVINVTRTKSTPIVIYGNVECCCHCILKLCLERIKTSSVDLGIMKMEMQGCQFLLKELNLIGSTEGAPKLQGQIWYLKTATPVVPKKYIFFTGFCPIFCSCWGNSPQMFTVLK